MDWKIGGRLEQWVTNYGYTTLAKTQLWWLAFLLRFVMVLIIGRLRGCDSIHILKVHIRVRGENDNML
jgi:hypothetical protein